MIYRDQDGYPTDQTLDGGDSAMRTGVLNTFGETFESNTRFYMVSPGKLTRHPKQPPWNNPKNFTRDQLIPFMAGLYVQDLPSVSQSVFWSHARRLFFCQNFERDVPGSIKFPWPHSFVNDQGEPELRFFDFADLLMPDQIWHLIRCARIKCCYWFAVLGIPWFCLSLFFNSRSGHKEYNQIICMAWVNGPWAIRLFKRLVKNWEAEVWEYWSLRSEPEYARLLIDKVNGVTNEQPRIHRNL